MYLINCSSLALLTLSFFTRNIIADSGYGATCNSIQLYDEVNSGWVVNATCKEISGIYAPDSIAINYCFGNSNGNLVGQLNGGFSGSCNDIRLSGTILLANCRNVVGNYNSASVDTNNYIGNFNGSMRCFS